MSAKRSTTKRAMALLDNDVGMYVYNMDTTAVLPATLILAGKPVPSEGEKGLQYRFSNAETGWFASINVNDTDNRLDNILQLKNEDIVIRIKALVTYEERDLKGAKAFVPAKGE